jgi:hypothetical protein
LRMPAPSQARRGFGMIVKGFADKPWNSVNKVALPEPAVQQMNVAPAEPILSRRAEIHKARFLTWNNADSWGVRG